MQRKDDVNLSEDADARRIEALLRGVARRSQKDFRMLVAASSPALYGVLMSMLRDPDAARDALQVTFTRIWLRGATFDPDRGSAGAWMTQIARHHAIDLLRQRKRRAEMQPDGFDDLPDSAPSVEERMVIRGDVRKLLGCLDKLEPKKAQAIRLSYLQGLSYAELADRLETPLNTIRTWLRRGLAALRECVDG